MGARSAVAEGKTNDGRRWALWKGGGLAALFAATANVVLYVAARAGGVPLELTEVFEDEFARIPVTSFVLATLLEGGLAATVTAAACRRWTSCPRRWFVALATVGTIVSFGLPLASDATTATIVVLCVSHVVAAVIIVPPLMIALPPPRQSPRAGSSNARVASNVASADKVS